MDKIDELHIMEYENRLIQLDTIKPWFQQTPNVCTTFEEAVALRRESIQNCIALIKSKA